MNYIDIWVLGVLVNFTVPIITSVMVTILLMKANGISEHLIQTEKVRKYLRGAGLLRHVKSLLFAILPFTGIISAIWMCTTLVKCKFSSEKFTDAIIKLDKKMYQGKEPQC